MPASSLFAFRHMERLIGTGPGIRVGDISTELDPGAGPTTPAGEYMQPKAEGTFPRAWVVRTSDMKVIADQNTSDYWLPFLLIAQDPDADWSSPPPPPPPPFESRCEDGDEEESEPNDTSFRPGRLQEGEQTGGICAPAPDFYKIRASTGWQVTLTFTHADGDLDLYLWNKDEDEIMTDEVGVPIGSWTESDTEVMEGTGNAIIMIMGYGGASNTYTLELELLE